METVGVQGEKTDPVTLGHVEGDQSTGEPGDAVDALAMGTHPLSADGGDGVRGVLHGSVQTLREVHGGSPEGISDGRR